MATEMIGESYCYGLAIADLYEVVCTYKKPEVAEDYLRFWFFYEFFSF